MKKVCVFISCLLFFGNIKAEKVYEFNSTCQQAYQEITKLKLENGLALIEKAKQQNPDNLIPLVLENYVDLFTLFFNEDAAEYARKKPLITERIHQLEQGQSNSPFYKFSLSIVYLQKAIIEIKFVEYWKASWDIRKSYLLIKENKKTFPTFSPNDLIFGSLQTVIATIPSGYTFFASLLGLNGSVAEGMRILKNFTNSNDSYAKLMSNESAFIYCYLLYHVENKKNEVFPFIQSKKLDLVNNHPLAFMAANLAKNNKQPELAKSIILNRNKSPEYLPLAVWDYELAFNKLHHLETQEAIKYFESFLTKFKGKFYVKDAYLKLSWCYFLQGNMQAAENARAQILKKGSTDTDADKQALKDAKAGIWPNALLLKARMLSDGGYYQEALSVLAGKTIQQFSKPEEKLEFTYRLARIYDDTNKPQEAIEHYQEAIQLGADRKEYYAARSALQIGEILEKQNKKPQAIVYFEQCLSMKGHEYKNSLDQRAKAGIARCKGE
ncbi:MAG: tetratricopeptide repeat protein [Chitinophagaceae bacterium]